MTADPGASNSSASRRSLEGEVALVTGGSRGIGLAIVALFVAEGAKVVFCGRDAVVGEEAAAELGSDDAAFVAADVGVERDVATVVAACRERFGDASVLVNNAGVNANFDATEMSEDE